MCVFFTSRTFLSTRRHPAQPVSVPILQAASTSSVITKLRHSNRYTAVVYLVHTSTNQWDGDDPEKNTTLKKSSPLKTDNGKHRSRPVQYTYILHGVSKTRARLMVPTFAWNRRKRLYLETTWCTSTWYLVSSMIPVEVSCGLKRHARPHTASTPHTAPKKKNTTQRPRELTAHSLYQNVYRYGCMDVPGIRYCMYVRGCRDGTTTHHLFYLPSTCWENLRINIL